jgi:ribonuclease-3
MRIQDFFGNSQLLDQAFTHKSYFYENLNSCKKHNETLEFLGDSVLSLVISEELMALNPEGSEGSLSKKRASLVNVQYLSQLADKLKLAELVRLGKGSQDLRESQRIKASVLEAVIGALFLDKGYDRTKEIVRAWFLEDLEIKDAVEEYFADFKTRLQEKVQKVRKSLPVYQIVGEFGPMHERTFQVELLIDGVVIAKGAGNSKKNAEQDAAQKALNWIDTQGVME